MKRSVNLLQLFKKYHSSESASKLFFKISPLEVIYFFSFFFLTLLKIFQKFQISNFKKFIKFLRKFAKNFPKFLKTFQKNYLLKFLFENFFKFCFLFF